MFTARLSIDGDDGRDEAIIRSSIELGHSLGLRVVAEGVERSDHFGFLATAGCDVAQGYAICFPQPPETWTLPPSMIVPRRCCPRPTTDRARSGGVRQAWYEYAAPSVRARSTRSPKAMFTSTRWSPHVGPSVWDTI